MQLTQYVKVVYINQQHAVATLFPGPLQDECTRFLSHVEHQQVRRHHAQDSMDGRMNSPLQIADHKGQNAPKQKHPHESEIVTVLT